MKHVEPYSYPVGWPTDVPEVMATDFDGSASGPLWLGAVIGVAIAIADAFLFAFFFSGAAHPWLGLLIGVVAPLIASLACFRAATRLDEQVELRGIIRPAVSQEDLTGRRPIAEVNAAQSEFSAQ